MAKQRGPIKLEGTIGDLTFFRTKDGYLARENNTVKGSRIASDPAFQRTRENMAEFGRAGKAGKILRTAFRELLLHTADGRMVSRLTTEMMKVLQADTSSQRGQRNVLDGECELLQGFEFNLNGKLSTTFFAPYTTTMDRVGGSMTVAIPPFVPANQIAAPAGATHFRILSAGAAVDFTSGTSLSLVTNSDVLPLNEQPTTDNSFTSDVGPNNPHPLFLVLGIEFYQQVNAGMYPLKNGAFNALQIIAVSGV